MSNSFPPKKIKSGNYVWVWHLPLLGPQEETLVRTNSLLQMKQQERPGCTSCSPSGSHFTKQLYTPQQPALPSTLHTAAQLSVHRGPRPTASPPQWGGASSWGQQSPASDLFLFPCQWLTCPGPSPRPFLPGVLFSPAPVAEEARQPWGTAQWKGRSSPLSPFAPVFGGEV